jgi:hypothetical protein
MAGDKKIGIRMKKARLDAGLLVIKLWLGRSVDSDISIRLFRRRTLTIGNTRWSYLNDDAINPTGCVQVFNEYSTDLTINKRTFVNAYIYGPMREAQNLVPQPLCYWYGYIAQVRYFGWIVLGSRDLVRSLL